MELTNKSLDELRAIAKELNIKVHHAAKEASIIKLIEAQQPHRVEAAQAEVVKVKPDVEVLTPEVVNKALAPLTEKRSDFEVMFLNDGTWLFRIGKREESGNMQIPLQVIKRRAELFCRQGRSATILGREGNDPSYTGAVLSAN
jgi:uncharacterized Zn finger protein